MQVLAHAIECLRQGPLPEHIDLKSIFSKSRAETDGHANDFSMRHYAQPLRGWSAASSIRQCPLDVECFFHRLKAAIRSERLFRYSNTWSASEAAMQRAQILYQPCSRCHPFAHPQRRLMMGS
jgi:hypothetical protein